MPIFVYNMKNETHADEPNVYTICRPSILGNPYSHLPEERTRAMYHVNTREEAIERYSHYFDIMYSGNSAFKAAIDEIYDKFKNGEDIYLACVCKPEPCHGDVIVKKLTSRLVKERFLKKS